MPARADCGEPSREGRLTQPTASFFCHHFPQTALLSRSPSGFVRIPVRLDAVVRRPWWRLKFPPDLETVFEAETGPGRSRRLARFQLLALVLYLLFLVADAELLPDVFETAATIRLGVVTPLAVVIILVLLRNPPAFAREGMLAAITVVVTASLMWVMSISRSPLQAHFHYGVVLVLLYANVALRIRFWYAAVASLLCLGIYVIGVETNPHIPAAAAGSQFSFLPVRSRSRSLPRTGWSATGAVISSSAWPTASVIANSSRSRGTIR